MFKTKGPSPLGTLVAAVALALSGAVVHAESACKGLEMAACEKAAECTWVGDYTRQDGIKVSGYCRTKTSPGGAKAPEGAMKPSQEAVSKPAPTGVPAPAPAGAAKPAPTGAPAPAPAGAAKSAPASAAAPAAASAVKPAQDDTKKAKDAEKPKEVKP